jgi:probable F420-dependent oxidoreductase
LPRIAFGIRLPVSGPLVSASAIERVAKRAEELGFDQLWARDNLHWDDQSNREHISEGSVEAFPPSKDPDIMEVITTLAYVAGLTKRIRFGSSIVTVHPRRDPIILAKQAAMLDVLSGGRFTMGLGVSGWENQWKALNEEEYFKIKWKYFEEAIPAMKEIWTKPYASFDGKYIKFKDVCFYPKPVQKPHMPLWYGGFSEGCFRRVAKHCTGWLTLPDRSPDEVRFGVEKIREYAREYGRGGYDFAFAAELHSAIGESDQEAEDKARKTLTTEKFLRNPSTRLGFSGGGSWENILGRTLVGSPNHVIKQMDKYATAGINHFEFKLIYMSLDDMFKQMETIADMVRPSFA